MSVRAQIIGDGLSGKSTVAAHIAMLLATLRNPESRKRKRRKKGASDPDAPAAVQPEPVTRARAPFVILTQPTTAYVPYGLDMHRTRTMAGLLQFLRSADAPLVVDDLSEFYALLVEAWRSQTSEHRDRANLPRKARLNPDEWQVINGKYREVFQACSRLGVDLVEIYRRGPIMVADADFGMVDGEGVKARGQAEAASGGDLVILLDGGLRSRYRETGHRVLRVLSDVSGRLNGRELPLPRLNEKGDRDRLDRELTKLLRPSLVDLIEWSDAEALEWNNRSEPEDSWSEAREAAQKAEAGLVSSQVHALLEIHGLGGRKAEVIQRRASLLFTHFGVGDVDLLCEVPALTLRENLPAFDTAVRSWNAVAA